MIRTLAIINTIILIIFFTSVNKGFTQDKFDSFIDNYIYLGMGVGPETGMSGMLPKISYYNFRDWNKLEGYYGIEGSIWVVEAGWLSGDFLIGIKKNYFTVDNSISLWWYPKTRDRVNVSSIGPYFHGTLNPKIGVKIWRLWLKAGPSVFLFRDYPKSEEGLGLLDLTKIDGIHYNFEILFKL